MSTADHAVQIENLTKVYKDFWGRDKVRALDSLNLTIPRGEVFGLLGPNGSGKSTTIKLLLGLIFPDRRPSGPILGQPAGNTSINERIGFLPEESYLYRFSQRRRDASLLWPAVQNFAQGAQSASPCAARHCRARRQKPQAQAARVLQGDGSPHRFGPGADQTIQTLFCWMNRPPGWTRSARVR